MSQTILPTSVQTPPTGSPAPSLVSATVPNPPPPLLTLPAGSQISGTVTSVDDSGHVLVRTDRGTLPLVTRVPLDVGAQITLQIRSQGAQLHVTITQIDGQPAHTRLAHSQASTAAVAASTSGKTVAPDSASAATGAPGSTPGSTPGRTSAELSGHASGPKAPNDRIALSGGSPDVAGTRPQSATGDTRPLVASLQAPPAIAKQVAQALASGAVRIAVVAPSPEGGTLRLQTALGTYTIATDADIAPGTTVRVLLRSTGPPPVFALEPTFPGRPTATSPPGTPPHGTPPRAPASSQPPTGRSDILTPGAPLRATVHAPLTGSFGAQAPGSPLAPGSPSAPGSPLPIGTSLDVRLLPTGSGPGPNAGPSAGPGQAPGSRATTAPNLPTPPAADLPAKGTLGPQQPPSAATRTVPTLQHAGASAPAVPGALTESLGLERPQPGLVRTLTGVIVGASAQDRPLLQTPVGLLALDTRATLPLGSRFTVEIASPHRSPLVLGERGAGPPLTSSWPQLGELLQQIQSGTLPGLAAIAGGSASIPPRLPQPGARLASSLLFFVAALSGGDAGAWLRGLLGARAHEALESSGRGELLSRLAQDFAQIGRMGDLAGPDWRFLPVPFFDGQQLQQLRLYLRRHRKRRGDEEGRPGDATRFIVEVRVRRLGELQLDGLVKERRFDLLMRSREPLPPVMRRRITEIFEAGRDATGYAGNIGFQASDDWIPMPLSQGAETGPPGSRTLVV